MNRSSVVKFMVTLGVAILVGGIASTNGLVFAQRERWLPQPQPPHPSSQPSQPTVQPGQPAPQPPAFQLDVNKMLYDLKAKVDSLSNDVNNLSAQVSQLKQAQQAFEMQYQGHTHELSVGILRSPVHNPNAMYLFTAFDKGYNYTKPPIPHQSPPGSAGGAGSGAQTSPYGKPPGQ